MNRSKIVQMCLLGAYAASVCGLQGSVALSSELSSCVVHYRADSGVELDSSGNVRYWRNLGAGGEGFDLVPTGGVSSAIAYALDAFGGRGALRFNGMDFLRGQSLCSLGTTTTSGGSWFIVYKAKDNQIANMGLWGYGPANGNMRTGAFSPKAGNLNIYLLNKMTAGAAYKDSNSLLSWNVWADGSVMRAYRGEDGLTSYSSDTAGMASCGKDHLRVGQMFEVDWLEQFQGDIAELRIYNRQLTPVERAQVELEMSARWGLSNALAGAPNPQELSSHAKDLAVMGGSPDFGPASAVVTSATSGDLTASYVTTPSAAVDSLLMVGHDGKTGLERTWYVSGSAGAVATSLRLSFNKATFPLENVRLWTRAASPNAWSKLEIAPESADGRLVFTLPAGWSCGVYRVLDNTISQPVAAYRADDELDTNAVGNVKCWHNLGTGGEGFDLVPTGGVSSAIAYALDAFGGRGALRFNGMDFLRGQSLCSLGTTTTSGGSWFIVYKAKDNQIANMGLWGYGPANGNMRTGAFSPKAGNLNIYLLNKMTAGAAYKDSNSLLSWNVWADGSVMRAYRGEDGLTSYSSDTAGMASCGKDHLRVGQMFEVDWLEQFQGDIAELRIYNRQLTPVERAQVELEMSARWGLSNALAGAPNPQELSSHAKDLAVMGGSPDFGPASAVVTSATSGDLTASYVTTPSAAVDSLLMVGHDGKTGTNCSWYVSTACLDAHVRFEFVLDADMDRYSYRLFRRLAGTETWVCVPCRFERTTKGLSTTVKSLVSGIYQLNQAPAPRQGLLWLIR